MNIVQLKHSRERSKRIEHIHPLKHKPTLATNPADRTLCPNVFLSHIPVAPIDKPQMPRIHLPMQVIPAARAHCLTRVANIFLHSVR